MASPALSAFTVAIGFEADEQSARRTGQQFDSIKKKALSLGAVLAGTFGVKQLTFGNAGFVDGLGKSAASIGMTADAMAAWDRVMQHWGMSAGQGEQQLVSLHAALSDLQELDPGAMKDALVMARLPSNLLDGVTDEGEALLRIAGATKGFSPELMKPVLDLFGLDRLTSRPLSEGRGAVQSEFDAESRRLRISQELVESSAEFNDNMQNLMTTMTKLGLAITTWILPPINKFLVGLDRVTNTARLVDKPTEGATQILPGVFISKNKAPEAAGNGGAPVQIKGIFNLNGRALGEVITEAIEGGNSQQQPLVTGQ